MLQRSCNVQQKQFRDKSGRQSRSAVLLTVLLLGDLGYLSVSDICSCVVVVSGQQRTHGLVALGLLQALAASRDAQPNVGRRTNQRHSPSHSPTESAPRSRSKWDKTLTSLALFCFAWNKSSPPPTAQSFIQLGSTLFVKQALLPL